MKEGSLISETEGEGWVSVKRRRREKTRYERKREQGTNEVVHLRLPRLESLLVGEHLDIHLRDKEDGGEGDGD